MEAVAEEQRQSDFLQQGDNTCPTFMTWGMCYRGDRCPLRHPTYRYLERPSRKTVTPECSPQQPKKRDPNSYAAILQKRKNSEPEEFFKEAVLFKGQETIETNGRSYSKALVNGRKNQDKSETFLTYKMADARQITKSKT